MKINLSFIYLILLFACEPRPINPQDNLQTITAKIDGIDFKASLDPNDPKDFEEIVTNQVTFSSGLGFVLAIAGADFSLEDAAVADIRLILIGPELTGLKPGTVINSRGTDSEPPYTSLMAAGGTTKKLLNEENAYVADTDDFGDIEVIITAFDTTARRMSGTFEFTAIDPDNDVTVNVTEGEFKNISW
jgi:hypothetical protein|tara:strand:+ start:2965 stop:3531 length:567 start_codon:yes stop_codon:yes gene_type:complete